jgi:hypothetical protein
METVKRIIEIAGYESAQDMELGDHIKVESLGSGMMDLSIEKVQEDRLSVAHYYTQRGDLMSDPEIVFVIEDDHWRAVRYTQHPSVMQYDEDGLPEVKQFAGDWNENLRDQKFIEAAEEQFGEQ